MKSAMEVGTKMKSAMELATEVEEANENCDGGTN